LALLTVVINGTRIGIITGFSLFYRIVTGAITVAGCTFSCGALWRLITHVESAPTRLVILAFIIIGARQFIVARGAGISWVITRTITLTSCPLGLLTKPRSFTFIGGSSTNAVSEAIIHAHIVKSA
jgi:hypothetical protein